MSSVLIIIEKLKFEDKFKYCTRESESNYHNKITQKLGTIILIIFHLVVESSICQK